MGYLKRKKDVFFIGPFLWKKGSLVREGAYKGRDLVSAVREDGCP